VDASDWDDRYTAAELVWSEAPNEFVVAEIKDLRPGAALDLACGEGRNAMWLAEAGWATTAVDFSAVGIAKARRLAGLRNLQITWLVGDVLALAPDPVWDFVLIAYLHLPRTQRESVVEMAGIATRPGGSVLVIGHDQRNLDEGVGGPQDRSLLWTPDEVDLPGFRALRRETAVRQTADGDALDTVVHIVRD
jgi:SAM-dependent methyltransferase